MTETRNEIFIGTLIEDIEQMLGHQVDSIGDVVQDFYDHRPDLLTRELVGAR